MPIVDTFVFLQLLDLLTTIIGLKWGAQELNPVILHVMKTGALEGLLASKVAILVMAGAMIWYRRVGVLFIVNYIFGGLIIWNVLQLMILPGFKT
jgi:Domain of unknown function (DUF5658)